MNSLVENGGNVNGQWLMNVAEGRWPLAFPLSRRELLSHPDQDTIEKSSVPDKQTRGQLHAFSIVLKIYSRIEGFCLLAIFFCDDASSGKVFRPAIILKA